jgi:DNA-binding response OmpR family regulator
MIAQTAHDQPTVLVVARGHQYGTFLREVLERDGYAVEVAPDGERGFQRALAGGVDLVVLHQRGADAGGAQWCRRLAALSRGRYLPVILLAERVRGAPPGAGLAAGVAAHLTRPLDLPELLRQARVWTEARARLRAFYARLLRAAELSAEASCA